MKKIIMMLVLVSVMVFLSFIKGYAETSDSSVYCVGDEAEMVYEIATTRSDFVEFFNTEGLTISKDRIMPLYSMNLLDYAWDDQLTILPSICNNHSDNEITEGNVYVTRVNFAENNEYAGYIQFCIEDGEAYMHFFSSSRLFDILKENAPSSTEIYIDYHDNEDIFSEAFRDLEQVTESKARLVGEPTLGFGFYISSEKADDVFIPCRSVYRGEVSSPRYYLADSELKIKANEVLEDFLAVKEQYDREYELWKKKPHDEGEQFMLYGYCPYPIDYLDEKISNTNRVIRADSEIIEQSEEIQENSGNVIPELDNSVESEQKASEESVALVGDISGNGKTISEDSVLNPRTNAEKTKSVVAYLYWVIPVILVVIVASLIAFGVFKKNKQA